MTTSNALELRLPRPGSLGAWILAARPATLPVAVAPVAVGTAVAAGAGEVRWPAVAAALGGALLIQIGTNLANDVFDHEKGADDDRRIGPPRAVQRGLLSPASVRRGMVVAFALAAAAGLYLAFVAGPVIVVIGLLSIASGIAYTGGPYPLGYNGLGDLFVFLFFGLVAVAGTALVAIGFVPAGAWPAGAAVGALATAVLVVNNVRDHEGDARAGKRTLVVRFGRRFGVAEHGALVVLSAAAPLAAVAAGWLPLATLASAAALPFGLAITRTLSRTRSGPELTRALAATAKLMLVHAALSAGGIAIGG